MGGRRRLAMLLSAEAVGFLTGCAVLTVDVDVYKGPLANHKDVQIEQMAAMAIGAKPLLVELRDTLEEGDPNRVVACYEAGGFRKWATAQCWYEAAYIGPAPGGTKSRFMNPDADRVNKILCLYEDRWDEQYALLIRRMREALQDYRHAYEILRPESMDADKNLWKRLAPDDGTLTSIAEKLPAGSDVKACDLNGLRKAYRDFYEDEYREIKAVFKAWQPIRERLGKLQKAPSGLEALLKHPLLKGKDPELTDSSNAAFHALAKTKLADFQAENLFGLKDEKKEAFVKRVKDISGAFLDARGALEDLWRAEMEAIVWLAAEGRKASVDWEQDIVEMARASLEVIQPRYVALFLEVKAETGVKIPNEVGYLKKLGNALEARKLSGSVSSKEFDFDKAKTIMLGAFREEPAQTAKGLLAAHEFCKWRFDSSKLRENVRDRMYHLQYESGWLFGLVRAPFEPNGAGGLAPKSLQENTEKVFHEGGEFAEGRLNDGLETLIEDYLREAERCVPNDESLGWARKRLSGALVRFAEKVLFVANNNNLLSPPKEPGLIPGVIDVSIRGVFGDRIRDIIQKWWVLECKKHAIDWPPPDDVAVYTRVLQAVGNSILVQVDAIDQEEAHERLLKRRRDRETDVLEYAVSKLGGAVCANEIVEREFSDINEPTAKDVRDVWLTLLRYEHDLALYRGEPNRVRMIETAIKGAEEKRAQMVYIRPAMAYLRTSFPATSLQDDPGLSWDNMLGGHAMRSIPFGPQLRDILDPDAKRDAMINAEIDKQFWQNINRVRVAGGGETNYVVAKDDIGNWYVKRYVADPKDIIKSAQSLAMFSMSARAGTSAAGQLAGIEGKKKVQQKPDAEESPMWPVFSKYRETYLERTQKDCEKLTNLLKDGVIETRIKTAWDENETLSDYNEPLKEALDGMSNDYLKPGAKKKAKTGEEIVRALGNIVRFHNVLAGAVADALTDGPANELTKAQRDAEAAEGEAEAEAEKNVKTKQEALDKAKYAANVARRDVTRIVREELTDIIRSRESALEDYEAAIAFVGKAMK
ncbi:MAG: hypothetical protein JSU94_13435 [Phycisphaerales bacterium]|nr:MAG: hypothetical protein JSU94_13435 [Phycisphaerales bacterium]